MNSALESRKNLVRVMEEIDLSNRRFETTLEEVSGFISEAMRATQFDDLLTQLLEGSASKLVTVGLLVKRGFLAVAEEGNHETCLEVRAVAQLLEDLAGPGAVSQTSMASGDVELF
jgi:hypothetical protein